MRKRAVFISYSRIDDASADQGGTLSGFVEYLRDRLRYHIRTTLGGDAPELWRDRERVPDGAPYEPLLKEGVWQASMLLIVLSENWIASSYCRAELDDFRARFEGSEEDGVTNQRIVVAALWPVDRQNIPSGLPKQSGYRFYREDKEDNALEPLFRNGQPGPTEVHKQLYDDVALELAKYLKAKSRDFAEKDGLHLLPPAPPLPPRSPGPDVPGRERRVVFLAKPAGDMEGAYATLVKELQGHGYEVVPDPVQDLPMKAGAARDAVETALLKAEVSIHLLGEKVGFTPEDGEPAVRLQLGMAAHRGRSADPGRRPQPSSFARLIWAPKVLPDTAAADRDPLEVLRRFQDEADTLLPGDKVVGDPEIAFRQFVVQHLKEPVKAPNRPVLPAGSKIFLSHDRADVLTAAIVGKALRSLKYVLLQAAVEGEAEEVMSMRRARLRDCDAVILCWSKASQLWVMSRADELASGKGAIREAPYAWRSVLQLDPSNEFKEAFRLAPHEYTDSVIDGTGVAETPEAVEVLVRAHLVTS